MSGFRAPEVKALLGVLRRATKDGRGALTMSDVKQLEACARSQVELLEALQDVMEMWLADIDPAAAHRIADRARTAIEAAQEGT